MLAMVEKGIFQTIDIYDYQALCPKERSQQNDGNEILHVSYNLNTN